MQLSILIPTYNRVNYLINNLNQLCNFIRRLNHNNEIQIIISDNCSSDTTSIEVRSLINNTPDIAIQYFKQEKNIGLEKNALFVLNKASSNFIMYLGDDDYIDFEYLKNTFNIISNKNSPIRCIIPAIQAIDENGLIIKGGRDLEKPLEFYRAGFKNCLVNSWRGHQLSGIILQRDNLYAIYEMQKVNNIYLFIFFVAYSCLNGKTIHYTKYPVNVTNVTQDKKDWNYGNDGLLNDVFDNYKKLPINNIKKTILQLYFFQKQNWRLWIYYKDENNNFFRALYNIFMAKNATFTFRLIFPFLVILQFIRIKLLK